MGGFARGRCRYRGRCGGLAGSLEYGMVSKRGCSGEGKEGGDIPHPLGIIGYGFAGSDYGFGRESWAFGGWGHVDVTV